MSDKEIIDLFRDQNTRHYGFNTLVKQYQQPVYWLIRRMVIDHEDTDDLVQEVFIKVWQGLDGFRGDAKLFTWIYRIATNLCLNHIRKQRMMFFIPIVDVEHKLAQSLTSDPYFEGDAIELKLQRAILNLPQKQRLVFNMKYFNELSYEEMSEILGTSIGALKASYHFAIKKIEESLKKD
jgi:RNA polymerase sigma-70 factor (ECF subfamily)